MLHRCVKGRFYIRERGGGKGVGGSAQLAWLSAGRPFSTCMCGDLLSVRILQQVGGLPPGTDEDRSGAVRTAGMCPRPHGTLGRCDDNTWPLGGSKSPPTGLSGQQPCGGFAGGGGSSKVSICATVSNTGTKTVWEYRLEITPAQQGVSVVWVSLQ